MNKHDRENLEFLLTADEDTFQEFLETVSEDDIEYALQLIQAHSFQKLLKGVFVC